MSNLVELKQAVLINTLRSCQLFAGLSPDDLQRLAGIVVIKTVAKGDYLFREGTPSHGFYIVQAGAINIHRFNAMGKEQVIHIFRQGESFAEASLAMPGGYPASARAVEPSQVLLVQKDGFLSLLRQHPDLAMRMIASLSLRLRVLVGQLEDMTLKDVETRLVNWLLKRCPNQESTTPHTIELTVTKRTLAAEIGTVSETLSRTLAKFREQGLLRVQGRRLTVVSPAKLNAVLKHHLGG